MNSTNKKIKGTANSSAGKIKAATGKIVNDKELEAKGLAQEEKGHLRAGVAIKKLGDKVEHLTD